MVSLYKVTSFSGSKAKLNQPVIIPFRGEIKPPENYPDYQQKIPDPIYNFLLDLPKYELHAHFNGSTPLNISKLFLNKEDQFIGLSQVDLEKKYDDIRKRSTSLADWLQKTYELKAKNISTMDVTTAAYAIGIEEAKHNCRYLEIRIDPFSSSFVGSPEDVIRAVEVGLRNATEDIKAQGKDFKSSIILLAERHAPAEKGLATAKLATKLKSQRVLFEQMYAEMKKAETANVPYKNSMILTETYVDMLKARGISKSMQILARRVYDNPSFNRESVSHSLDHLEYLLSKPIKCQADKIINQDKIDKVYKNLIVTKAKSISTIDLAPAVYSIVMEKAKKGERNINITIDPTDPLFVGNPQDILRAVQVGLRNAEVDLEPTCKINTGITIQIDTSKNTPEEATKLANFVVRMKSQRVVFDKMYVEMKEALKGNHVFDQCDLLDEMLSDISLIKELKENVKTIIDHNENPDELKTKVNSEFDHKLKEVKTQFARILLKNCLKDFNDKINMSAFDFSSKDEIHKSFEKLLKPTEDYIEEKTVIAKKIFDALRHLSTLKLEDDVNHTKNYDRYLRMGTGVIPNVIGLNLKAENKSSIDSDFSGVYRELTSYNSRKVKKDERLDLSFNDNKEDVNLKDTIINGKCLNGKFLSITEDEANPNNEGVTSRGDAASSTIYSKETIVKDIQAIKKLIDNPKNPEQYLKVEIPKALKELADKINTQKRIEEEQFILAKRIQANLEHFNQLQTSDKLMGTKNAKRYTRMGIDIIPNVSGFDIAGNENDYPLYLQTRALDHIKAYNENLDNPEERLKVTVHAGEVKQSKDVTGWQNILHAIRHGAHRIGHGIDLRNAPQELKDEVKLRNITIETCPKSNYQTQAVDGYREHPLLDFLDEGIPAIVNTDNPVTSGTNITNEFVKIFKRFNCNITDKERAEGVKERLTLGHIKAMVHNAIWGAFSLTPQQKVEEEQYAMKTIDEAVHKYEDQVVLKDNEPIMMKVQKQVVSFAGSLMKKFDQHFNQQKVA